MHWYKKSQYSVEDYQATPLPAVPAAADAVRSSGEMRETLPETPEIPSFWEITKNNPHYDLTCSNCGARFKCRCLSFLHKTNPQVKANIPSCPVCSGREGIIE